MSNSRTINVYQDMKENTDLDVSGDAVFFLRDIVKAHIEKLMAEVTDSVKADGRKTILERDMVQYFNFKGHGLSEARQ